MPNYDELAQKYARKIRLAINEDRADKKLSSTGIRNSRTLRELLEISRELNRSTDKSTGKPLSDQQKRDILERTDRELSIGRGATEGFVKAANNDKLVDLINQITSQIK